MNYLQLKQQIWFTIASHAHKGYLDGSAQVDELIVNADDSKNVNPTYSSYKEQDTTLASWLVTSISSSLLPNLDRHVREPFLCHVGALSPARASHPYVVELPYLREIIRVNSMHESLFLCCVQLYQS